MTLANKATTIKMDEKPLSSKQALEIILSTLSTLTTEAVSLRDAHGRVLGQSAVSDINIPPFDNSAMDGYAVRSSDIDANVVCLKVIGDLRAGEVSSLTVNSGEAMRIMTGALIPNGADAVIPVELTERQQDSDCVFTKSSVSAGDHIRRIADDVRKGQAVLSRGTLIGAAEMGMLATIGIANPCVFRRPRVAVITTGDELVDVSELPSLGQIRDSNQYSTIGLLLRDGCDVVRVERVTDKHSELHDALERAIESSDAIITCGGVSVGDFDFVKDKLQEMGQIYFWRVAIKPGKPFAFGRIQGIPVFGLPGNPISSIVTYDLFVSPALQLLGGRTISAPLVLRAVSGSAIKHRHGRTEYVRACLSMDDNSLIATSTGEQESHRLGSMLGADCYIVIPEDQADISKGDIVAIRLL